MSDKPDDMERANELFAFLQGNSPKDCVIKRSHMPKLTPDQAWTVIWYLGNEYWRVPDYIERCCLCGELYDSNREGACLDYGKPPYHFCEQCQDGEKFVSKMRRNPDKRVKDDYFESSPLP